MKYFSTPILHIMITLMISGCVTQAPPTASPIDLQGTVAAAAMTVVAETQAAIPTSTPVPPTATSTNTPLPTNTFLPPSAGTITPVPNGNSGGGDPCIYSTLPAPLKGEPVKIRIDNSTKSQVSVSVYLNQTVPQSICGYRSYSLAPGEFIVLNDLVEGCYTLWAWDPDPDTYFMVTNGTSCINKSDPAVFGITTSSIQLRP